jgi:transposase
MARLWVDDGLWDLFAAHLPQHTPTELGGRPASPDRATLTGIIFVLRTGIPWEDLPGELGCSGMTCWRRLRDWQHTGILDNVLDTLLSQLQREGRLDWSRATIDSAQAPAKKGEVRRVRIPQIVENRAQNTILSLIAAARRSRIRC